MTSLTRNAIAAFIAMCGGALSGPATADRDQDYHDLLSAAIAHGFPGVTILIDADDGDPWVGSAGYSNLIDQTPLRAADPFHLASVTKLITTTAALRLVDQGRLSLDAHVSEYLDASLVRDIPNMDQITVRQLLSHESGLYSFNNDPAYWDRLLGSAAFSANDWTPPELMGLVRAGEPQGEPGSGFHYADSNMVLLGEIIARVADAPFKDFVRTEIFGPLRMMSVYFYSDYRAGNAPGKTPLVEGYLVDSEIIRSFIDVHPDFPTTESGLIQATAGHERSDTAAGVVATASDMYALTDAVFRRDFLSRASKDVLLAPLRELKSSDAAAGALRAYRKPYGGIIAAEGDGPGGVNTVIAYHPATDRIVIVFGNLFGQFDESDFIFDQIIAPAMSAD